MFCPGIRSSLSLLKLDIRDEWTKCTPSIVEIEFSKILKTFRELFSFCVRVYFYLL